MWFATDGKGVTVYDGTRFVNYNNRLGLRSKTIYSIVEDAHQGGIGRGDADAVAAGSYQIFWRICIAGSAQGNSKADNNPDREAANVEVFHSG